MGGLSKIVDLQSAIVAIDTIVTQGEGSPAHHEASHYQKFLTVQTELAALQSSSPKFCPAHAAARNPVMRKPPEPEGRVWVSREPAASLLDLGNSVYAFMLRGLDLLFSHPVDDEARDVLVEAAIGPMRALAPIATHLPRLPATDDDSGPRAGLTFTMSRTAISAPDFSRAVGVLAEQALAIAAGYDRIALPIDVGFTRGRDAMRALGEKLIALAARPGVGARGAESRHASQSIAEVASDRAQAPAPSSGAADTAPAGFEIVRGKRITLQFEAKRCIHARHCVLETPEVFLANVKGPWIHPDEAPIDRLVHVARSCPSGAITYERLDGGQNEEAPPVNLLSVRERGPLAVHAELHVDGRAPCHRATLCRCGASKNKPYCDGSHKDIGFDATGEPVTVETPALQVRVGRCA